MNFLDDLFNSKSSLPLEKISEMIAIDLYWQIIENSLATADNLKEQEINLINELSLLTAEDIIGFKLRTDFFMFHSYLSDLWYAAIIMNEECSDLGFESFRYWLISQGKDIYANAMMNPDNLAKYFEDGFNEEDLYEFENFGAITENVFTKIFNHNIHDYIDYENFFYQKKNYSEMNINWEEDNNSIFQAICPKLFHIFIENISEYDDSDDDDDQSDEFDID